MNEHNTAVDTFDGRLTEAERHDPVFKDGEVVTIRFRGRRFDEAMADLREQYPDFSKIPAKLWEAIKEL